MGSHRQPLLTILVLLAAFALRCWELDRRSLWFDEGMEFWVATAAPTTLWASVREGIQDPPLYSALLHQWMRIGASEFILRYLSVLASLLSVTGVVAVGRRVGGEAAGLIAGVLLALSPAEIRYAQEAGQYGLMVCLLTWMVFLWQDATQQMGRLFWLGWLLLAVAATYTYYGAILTVGAPAALLLAILVGQRRWQPARKSLLFVALFALCVTPLLLFFLPQQLLRGPTAQAWQPIFEAPLVEAQHFLRATAAILAFQFTGWPWSGLPLWLPVGAVLLAFGAACTTARSNRSVRLLLRDLIATITVFYLASRLNLFPYTYRYGLILTPLLMPAIGAGIAALLAPRAGKRFVVWAGLLVLGSLIAGAVVSLPHQAVRDQLWVASTPGGWPEREEMRPLATYWLRQRRPDHPTYVYYGAAPAFRYYLRLAGADPEPPSPTWFLDCWRASAQAACALDQVYYGRSLRSLEPAAKAKAVLAQLPPDFAEGWLIFSHVVGDEQQIVLQAFLDHYAVVEQMERPGAALYRLRRL